MTTLVLSPDFLSHYQPMSAVARALRDTGERVIVATGPTMRPNVERDRLEWRHLRLAGGSNDGLASRTGHDPSDSGALDAFIDATRSGPVATLAFQARKRRSELLWNPVEVGRSILALLDEIEPEHVIVDQVSLGSTLGLAASERPFTTIVPGHPSQLPVADEQYGDLLAWPAVLRPEPDELDRLRRTVGDVNSDVTATFNEALARLTRSVDSVDDAFAVHGACVAYHWETELHDPRRIAHLPAGHLDLGPLVRSEPLPAEYASVVDGDGPLVVIALGTFLVHRWDILDTAMRAVERVGARAVVAVGDHDPGSFVVLPTGSMLRPRIPQVALLQHADCMISHAGNGSVQEALSAGVRQLLLPLSTDQMCIAADLVRTDRAIAADPNRLEVARLAEDVSVLLSSRRPAREASSIEKLVVALTDT